MSEEHPRRAADRPPATVVNGYVLPLPRGEVALVDCDLRRLAAPSGRVRLALYSLRPLTRGELDLVRDYFEETLANSTYAAAQVAAVFGLVLWWGVLALVATLILALRAIELGPSGTWAAAVLAGLSLPLGSGLGLESWRAYQVARLARRVREVEAQPGEQASVRERVEELWRQYGRMSGREVEVLRRLEDASREARWSGAEAFYGRRRAWLEAGTGESARAVGVVQRLWGRLQGPPIAPREIALELQGT